MTPSFTRRILENMQHGINGQIAKNELVTHVQAVAEEMNYRMKRWAFAAPMFDPIELGKPIIYTRSRWVRTP